MLRLKSSVIVIASLISLQARAGDAGCGLGSVVIQKNSKLLQLFAVTTNGTFFSQAFGITSGTSNCSASGIVMNDKAIQYFAEVNKNDLSREMSEGKGEKLAAFASLHGCNQEGQKLFATIAQQEYEKIFPTAETTPAQMVENVQAQVNSHENLKQNCAPVAIR